MAHLIPNYEAIISQLKSLILKNTMETSGCLYVNCVVLETMVPANDTFVNNKVRCTTTLVKELLAGSAIDVADVLRIDTQSYQGKRPCFVKWQYFKLLVLRGHKDYLPWSDKRRAFVYYYFGPSCLLDNPTQQDHPIFHAHETETVALTQTGTAGNAETETVAVEPTSSRKF